MPAVCKFDQVMCKEYGGNGVSQQTIKKCKLVEPAPKKTSRKPEARAVCRRHFCARGVVNSWNEEKGFGFIVADDEQSESVIFYKEASDVALRKGMKVSFTAVETASNRLKAVDVAYLGSGESAPSAPKAAAMPDRPRRFQAQGEVTTWKPKQGMGFITTEDKQTVVCYSSDVGELKVGMRVRFTALSNLSRGYKAVDLESIKDPCKRVPWQDRKHGSKEDAARLPATGPVVSRRKPDDDQQSEVSTTAESVVAESVVVDDSWVFSQLG